MFPNHNYQSTAAQGKENNVFYQYLEPVMQPVKELTIWDSFHVYGEWSQSQSLEILSVCLRQPPTFGFAALIPQQITESSAFSNFLLG